jgi:hypothetical protein
LVAVTGAGPAGRFCLPPPLEADTEQSACNVSNSLKDRRAAVSLGLVFCPLKGEDFIALRLLEPYILQRNLCLCIGDAALLGLLGLLQLCECLPAAGGARCRKQAGSLEVLLPSKGLGR